MTIFVSALAALTVRHFRVSDNSIPIREGFAIAGISTPGRVPFGFDSLQDQIVNGTWQVPKDGDSLATPKGGTAHWRHVIAGKDGNFGELPTGYVASVVKVPADGAYLLTATGDSLVYVNGTLRAGDPYGYGYLKLPVWLKKGGNTFVFAVGRGSLRAQLQTPRALLQVETDDSTVPDIIVGGPTEVWAAVVVLNSTPKPQRVSLFVRNSTGEAPMVSAEIPSMSFRKVPVKIRIPEGDLGKEQKFEIECHQSHLVDKANLTLAVKKPNETHRETFFSSIDGSLQYYAVNPSQKPSRTNALVLSLHGASVEAIGQASAYGSKDWCTLVAPTNRRPYGFDWEDIGRLDALEVLNIAKKEFPHEPNHVHLTGHSMGGHGTWSVGTLYPDQFASIAPSAGWISFWSYAGGYKPANPTPVEEIFVRAMAPSDTLARVQNTLEEKVYILHGDQDDNVPVEQAREMKKVLTHLHSDFGYHEQPGAGHWWGSPCVDWPGIFDQIRSSRIPRRESIDFTTPSPAVSSHDEWVTVLEQDRALLPSRVQIDRTEGKTVNVRALRIDQNFDSLTLDSQPLGRVKKGSTLEKVGSNWHIDHLQEGQKSPTLSGPFKNVFQNHFVFVIGTHGTAEENAWAIKKAQFDAEMFEYRGNGSVDIVTDSQYNSGWNRNVILYGNADTNSAWASLLRFSPIQVSRGKLKVGEKTLDRDDLTSLFVYPHKSRGHWILVGAISGTGLKGFETADRLNILTSGVAYPDWTIISSQVLKLGSEGVVAAGFFDNSWKLSEVDSAWNP